MYLVLSIFASTIILILFRLFRSFSIDNKQAIVFNYLAACLCGVTVYSKPINYNAILDSDWFLGALILGFLFIFIFNIMALTAQKNGLSVASVASKMSVVIPILAGILLYNERLSFIKLIGIVLALMALILASVKREDRVNLAQSLYLPVILFFGSGVIDASLKYLETTYVQNDDIPIFSSTIFFFAGFIGLIWMIINKQITRKSIQLKSILAGFTLGIVNYFSVFFLLKALQHNNLESSTIFTINNVAIVTVTSLVGFLFFKESVSKVNLLGICIAIAAIILMSINL